MTAQIEYKASVTYTTRSGRTKTVPLEEWQKATDQATPADMQRLDAERQFNRKPLVTYTMTDYADPPLHHRIINWLKGWV